MVNNPIISNVVLCVSALQWRAQEQQRQKLYPEPRQLVYRARLLSKRPNSKQKLRESMLYVMHPFSLCLFCQCSICHFTAFFDVHFPSQEAELERLSKARDQELGYKKQMDYLEVDKQQKMAEIESQRFSQLVSSLGTETLKEMARAGPELQVHLFSTGCLKNKAVGMT